MKKKICFLTMILAVTSAIISNLDKNSKDVVLSNLALNNIEVLAYGESSDDFFQSTGCVAVWDNVTCGIHKNAIRP